jgi:hypothetical protein
MGLDRSDQFQADFGEGTARAGDRNLGGVEVVDVQEQDLATVKGPHLWLWLFPQRNHLSADPELDAE